MRVRACGRLEDRVDVVDSLLPPQADVLARGKQVALEVLENDRDGTARSSASTSARSRSSQRILPVSGRYSPASIFASVVLPEPFSPTSAMISPLLISSETPSTAGRSDSGYVNDTSSTVRRSNDFGAGVRPSASSTDGSSVRKDE